MDERSIGGLENTQQRSILFNVGKCCKRPGKQMGGTHVSVFRESLTEELNLNKALKDTQNVTVQSVDEHSTAKA